MNRKYEVKPEWTQQALVVYGGLIAIGVVIIQGLLGMPSLDLPSLISVVSFAVAIPLLATLVLINHSQASYKYASYPFYLSLAVILGEGFAFLGTLAPLLGCRHFTLYKRDGRFTDLFFLFQTATT